MLQPMSRLLGYLLPACIAMLICACSNREVVTRYPHGQTRERYFICSDADGNQIRVGKYRRYYQNGVTEFACTFVSGKISGSVSGWHENGAKAFEGRLQNLPKGSWTELNLSHALDSSRCIVLEQDGMPIVLHRWNAIELLPLRPNGQLYLMCADVMQDLTLEELRGRLRDGAVNDSCGICWMSNDVTRDLEVSVLLPDSLHACLDLSSALNRTQGLLDGEAAVWDANGSKL
jgi:hypothetical protein